MKKILFAAAVLLSMSSFAADAPVSEKVLKAFNEVFGYVKKVDWSEKNNEYEAYFKEESVVTRIRYDKEGNIVMSIRSYGEAQLPLLIQSKIKKAYSNMKVFGVTEISHNDETRYEISLEGEKSSVILKSDAMGYLEVSKKFKKG